MRFFLLILLLFSTLFAEEEQQPSYQLGEGIQVASLPLYLGGYISLDYTNAETFQRYRLDDIALLAYGEYGKLSYMAELEFKEFYAYIQDDNGTNYTQKDTKLYIERLFGDYTLNENYRFRFGKYNSPIGFWNLLPINVLRETSSNPLITSLIFPKFTTGADITYTSYLPESEIEIDLILQNNDSISDDYNNFRDVDEHFGLGLTYAFDDYTFKLNGGYFHKRTFRKDKERDHYYALVAARYETEKLQLQTELATQRDYDSFSVNYAGYIQGLYRFTPKHIAIVRFESYDNVEIETKDSIAIAAYTYRPLYPIAFKSEYQLHSLHSEDKLLFSFSVMF